MRKSKIKLFKYVYPSGATCWRVSGSVDGKQFRKNFQSKAEATDYKQKMEIRQLNGPEQGRLLWSRLDTTEHDDAFAALRLLRDRGSPRSLVYAVQYFLDNHQEVDHSISIKAAVNEYINLRERETDDGEIEDTSLRTIRSYLKAFAAWIGDDSQISTITQKQLEEYLGSLNKGKPSQKTWNNVRGMLSHLYKWAYQQKYVAENPIPFIKTFKDKRNRSTAKTLSKDQVAEIMAYAEENPGPNKWHPEDYRRGMLVPYLSLTIFAGIRPSDRSGEMTKLIPSEHIDMNTGIIRITPDIAKTDELRKIWIQPNLRAWLEKYPLDEYPIWPIDLGFRTEMAKLRKKFKIPHDGLRHTYISMLVGSFRSVADAALQAGNTEAVIRKHYLDLKSVQEADEFWQIVPNGCKIGSLTKIREESRFILKDEEADLLRVM